TAVSINAFDNLEIQTVRVNVDKDIFIRRKKDRLTINVAEALPAGRPLTIALEYHGSVALSNGQGDGLLATRHGTDGITVMANLSEPYAAPSWWPCIDDV